MARVGLGCFEDLTILQSYHDLEAGEALSLEIVVTRPGLESRAYCSIIQDL